MSQTRTESHVVILVFAGTVCVDDVCLREC